jgi:glycosyltransferase involved in cell wall biosynthesis
MPSVDVFVPCYNYGRFLRECVGSILAQDGVEVRVLILDDCSSDDSPGIGRALAAADQRVEYHRHATNRGHIATYNEGIDWAAGDYTLLLSADDLLTQGALARAAGLMRQHPEVGMTYGDIVRTPTPDFAALAPPAAYGTEVIAGPEFVERCCRACSNLVETATAVVRTSVQKAIGGYRKELPHAGDLEMWLRCASVSAIGRVEAPQGFYRRHGANMSTDYVERKDYDQVRKAFDYFFAEFGARLPERDRLRNLVRQGLATQAFYLANDAFDTGDARLCTELLADAESLWPGIRGHRGWGRLRLKRLLGNRCWRMLRSLLRRPRRSAVPAQIRS